MTERAAGLRTIAQANADLADARHAQASSLCLYLLDMREFFRWQRGLPLDHPLPRADLGPWIAEREALWERLRDAADAGYRALLPEVDDDPFATVPLAGELAAEGLVYGAGIGRFGRPLFFLARLLDRELREGCTILTCGEELARGAIAPPAMSRGNEVVVRQDALERWLWTRYEEWRLHPRDNGLAAAYAIHEAAARPGGRDAPAVIRRMAVHEREAVILHELGERRLDPWLGDDWHDLIEEAPSRKAEVLARAVRDLLADCTVTLPVLLERDDAAAIHCWFGLVEGLRGKLAGALLTDYRSWRSGDRAVLAPRVEAARRHWADAAQALLRVWRDEGPPALDRLVDDESLIFT